MAGFQMAQHQDKPYIYYVYELYTTQNNSHFVHDRCSFLIVFVIFLYYNFYITKNSTKYTCSALLSRSQKFLTAHTLFPTLSFETEGIVQCETMTEVLVIKKNNLRYSFTCILSISLRSQKYLPCLYIAAQKAA